MLRIALPVLAATLAGVAAPAHAHTCEAAAQAPTTANGVMTGRGSVSCATPQTGFVLYVCLEVLRPNGLWTSYACATSTRPGPNSFWFGSVTAPACPAEALLARTAVYVATDSGANDYAESTPVLATCASS